MISVSSDGIQKFQFCASALARMMEDRSLLTFGNAVFTFMKGNSVMNVLVQEKINPLFSVVIPVYNLEDYIAETLESIYNQIWEDFEIIVVDDGSTDNTRQILAAQTDKRLRVIHQANSGVSQARNTAIRAAVGQYIAFIDGDDLWFPEHLMFAAECIQSQTNVDWYASRTVVGTNVIRQPDSERHILSACRTVNYFTTPERSRRVSPQSTVIRRNLLPDEFFPVGIKYGEDMIAWFRMAVKYPLLTFNSAVTAVYRKRPGSAMQTSMSLMDKVKQDAVMFDSFQEIAAEGPHSVDVQVYLSRYSLSLWLNRIMSTHAKAWLPFMKQRQQVTGRFFSAWIALFVFSSMALAWVFAVPLMLLEWKWSKTKS